jgi:hypothetical protein
MGFCLSFPQGWLLPLRGKPGAADHGRAVMSLRARRPYRNAAQGALPALAKRREARGKSLSGRGILID